MEAVTSCRALTCAGLILVSVIACGQKLVLNEGVLKEVLWSPLLQGPPPVLFSAEQTMDYSVDGTGLCSVNQSAVPDLCLINLLQRMKLQSQITAGKRLKIATSFQHDLGIEYLPDSLFLVNPDENALDLSIDVLLFRNVTLNGSSRFSTRLFNSYNYGVDTSGTRIRSLNSSFFTPLTWTFSGGFGWKIPKFGNLNVGISAGKLTWVMNKRVFSRPGTEEVFGVQKEKSFCFEYGLGLQVLLERDVFSRVHWNCDIRLFKNYRKPVDLRLENMLGISLWRNMKTSIRTMVTYDRQVSPKLRLENRVSLGFSLSL